MCLVRFEWVDSTVPTSGWEWIEDMEPPEQIVCRTVGWLISDGDVYVIAPTYGLYGGWTDPQVCGIMHIPRVSVLGVSNLEMVNLDEKEV